MQIIINADTPKELIEQLSVFAPLISTDKRSVKVDLDAKGLQNLLAETKNETAAAKADLASAQDPMIQQQISLSDIAPPKPQTATPTPAPAVEPAQAALQPLPVQPVMPVSTPAQVQPSLPTAPAPSYTQEQISVACVSLADQGKRAEVLQLMQSFGAASIIELKPEQYGSFALALRQMGAQI